MTKKDAKPDDSDDGVDTNETPLTVVFADGCFDGFDGTQDELDEMMASIIAMAQNGELLSQATVVDMDELALEDPELAEALVAQISGITGAGTNRTLH